MLWTYRYLAALQSFTQIVLLYNASSKVMIKKQV